MISGQQKMMINDHPGITDKKATPSHKLIVAVDPDIEILSGLVSCQCCVKGFDHSTALRLC